MKRILFVVVLTALCLSTVSVRAMEMKTYSGSISPGKGFIQFITTHRIGDVIVHVEWSGKPTGHGIYYSLMIRHCPVLTDNCDYSYDLSSYTASNMWSTPEMSVSLLNAPAGRYRIDFAADTKASFVLDVIAETNP